MEDPDQIPTALRSPRSFPAASFAVGEHHNGGRDWGTCIEVETSLVSRLSQRHNSCGWRFTVHCALEAGATWSFRTGFPRRISDRNTLLGVDSSQRECVASLIFDGC